MAAGEAERWAEVAHEPLRGMTRPMQLMAPIRRASSDLAANPFAHASFFLAS